VTPVVQKTSIETLLSDLLIRRNARNDEKAAMRERKLALEERKMLLEENQFAERKRMREFDEAKDDNKETRQRDIL
jgi:hypothetical protein